MALTSRQRLFWQVGITFTTAVAIAAGAFDARVFTQGSGGSAPQAGAAAPAPAQQPGRGAAPPAGGRGGGSTVAAGAPRNINADYSAKPPVQGLSPAEEAKHFILPPGYRMELVMAEPSVINPVAIAWDGNGRMYVAEMRTYMPDADGSNQHAPESVISVHESSKGDGVYDVHRVYQDKLILPRMVLPLDKGILTNETDSNDVIRLEDTNGDGVADKRSVFYTGVGLNRDGNLEHEQSGFVWGLDNWIYSTYNAFRFRWTPTGILREPTGPNGGQWGLSMDDDGKIWWVDAGSERGPVNFQVPIHYGSFNLTGERAQGARPGAFDQFEPNFEIVYPAPGWGDVQGGMDRVRMPVNNLNHFTSTNGQEIVRSDRYPEDMYGDLVFAEPVGRLIRRAQIVKSEGLTQLKNVYPGSEFILSTDPVFRPVNMKIGPDGALYIVDMYHGIIQESTWTPKGSYLRRKIEQYGMEKVVGHGRIWRLRYDGIPATPATASSPEMPAVPGIAFDNTKPRMLDETPAQLVAHLSHANGWWRDTAQRLLVLKQDKSVVPALQQLVRTSPSLVGRFHALWTLEGLSALDAALVREQMKDPEPRMRVQAVRVSETLFKAGNRTFDADYRALTKDTDPDVVIQAMLTMKLFNLTDFAETAKTLGTTNSARGVKEFAELLTRPAAAPGGGGGRGGAMSSEMQQMMERGGQVFTELCYSCHGEDGRGRPLAGGPAGTMMAPALAGSPRVNGHRDYIVKVLLNGMTGPLADNTYSEVMVPMRTNTDDWVASIATYVKNSFGNTGGVVTPADVARVRAATANRKGLWTESELLATLPRMLEVQPTWKATASHNSAAAPIALTLKPWSSNAPQAPGMWYQIELPQPVMLTEIQFDSQSAGGRGGGRGGFGGPPAPGAPAPAPSFTSPRGYKVDVSMDGTKWSSKPVAVGKANAATTSITFTPVRAKFVRITQTDTTANAPNWAMTNLRLYEAGPAAAK
jgi:mono/diheme cytochrome c family protein